MEESVSAKLKQLAEELLWIQQIFLSTIPAIYPEVTAGNQRLYVDRKLVEQMLKSVETIGAVIDCEAVRNHIQNLGSHACWSFVIIEELGCSVLLEVISRLQYPESYDRIRLYEDATPLQLGQLSSWLHLIAGIGQKPKQQELDDAGTHVFKGIELEIMKIVGDSDCSITNVKIHAARDTDSDLKTTKTTVKKLIQEGFLVRPNGERSGVALSLKGRLALYHTTKDSP